MKQGLIIDKIGNRRWFKDDQFHREDGPAIELITGSKFWAMNGLFHREDGPAIEYISGNKVYYFHGKFINCSSTEEFIQLIKLKSFW